MGRPPEAPRKQPQIARIENADRSVSAEVIKALTASFFAGGFEPGRRLPSERQLSESLGVSRSAVRDAVQPLGLLEPAWLGDPARDRVHEFLFLCLPPRFRGVTGSTVRPVAVAVA